MGWLIPGDFDAKSSRDHARWPQGDGAERQRTARGHLSEFGIITAKGIGRVDELLELAASDTTLPDAAKSAVKVLALHLEGLDKSIDLEDTIASAHAQSRLLDEVPGIGKIVASVIAASALDPSVFKSGRDFAAWLGITPRQNSTGRVGMWRGGIRPSPFRLTVP